MLLVSTQYASQLGVIISSSFNGLVTVGSEHLSVGAMCVLKLLCAAAPLRRSSRLFPCACALLRRCAVVRLRLRQCAAALLRRCAVVWLQLRRCAAALLRRCAVVIGCTCAGALLRRCAEQVS